MSLSQTKRIKLQTELTASYRTANIVALLSTILLPWSFLRTRLPSVHSKDGESSTTQVSLVQSGIVYLFSLKPVQMHLLNMVIVTLSEKFVSAVWTGIENTQWPAFYWLGLDDLIRGFILGGTGVGHMSK